MEFAWKDALSVGNVDIDNDHKHLFALANRFFQALNNGEGDAIVGETLEALVEYTATHFAREESLMRRMHYQGLDEHKTSHDELVLEVKDLQQQFKDGAIPQAVDVFNFVDGWLRNHVLSLDLKLGTAFRRGRL